MMKWKHQNKRYTSPVKEQQIINELRLVYNIIMEYRKIANLLNMAANQPPKLRTQNQVEINVESRGTYSVNREINFKTSMLKKAHIITINLKKSVKK